MDREPRTARTIGRFIQTAAQVYHHFYGAYPDSVGLDYFTRYRAFQQHYPNAQGYTFLVVLPLFFAPMDLRCRPERYERISLSIVPATFGPLESVGHVPRPVDPSLGLQEVLCQRGEHEALIHLLVRPQGYSAAIWDHTTTP